MTEAEGFLRAIAEDPDEDAHRLVFADWLDDHGSPEQAAFIRVQCALARLPMDHQARQALRAEEARLKPAVEALLPRLRGITWGTFERGLVTYVRAATPAAFRRHATRVAVTMPIVKLGLMDTTGLAALARVPQIALLREMPLANNHLTEADLVPILESPHCPRLTRLDAGGNQLGPGAARALAGCARMDRLASLQIYINRIGDEGMEALAASPHLAGLRVLNAHTNGIGPAGARALAASVTLGGLQNLHLSGPIGLEGGQALAASPHLTGLTELVLQESGMGGVGAAALAASPNFAGLTLLVLRDPIGPDGGRALAASPHLRRLGALILFGCHVGDEGAEALARSPLMDNLDLLNLCYNDLTDAAARALAESAGLRNLKRMGLVLHGNPGITAEGEHVLRQRFGDERLSLPMRG
jgi:uncharacterized protein (TIGR02996 family)